MRLKILQWKCLKATRLTKRTVNKHIVNDGRHNNILVHFADTQGAAVGRASLAIREPLLDATKRIAFSLFKIK